MRGVHDMNMMHVKRPTRGLRTWDRLRTVYMTMPYVDDAPSFFSWLTVSHDLVHAMALGLVPPWHSEATDFALMSLTTEQRIEHEARAGGAQFLVCRHFCGFPRVSTMYRNDISAASAVAVARILEAHYEGDASRSTEVIGGLLSGSLVEQFLADAPLVMEIVRDVRRRHPPRLDAQKTVAMVADAMEVAVPARKDRSGRMSRGG